MARSSLLPRRQNNIRGISGAVHALHHALVEDAESDNVKAACALTLITNAKFLCSIDPVLGRSVKQAFDFVSDNTSKGNNPKMVVAVFTKALQLLTDKEMVTNHEGICHPLMKLTGQVYALLEKPLRLNAIAAMHKACVGGSATLMAEYESFMVSSTPKNADEDCRGLAEAAQALSKRNAPYRIINLAVVGDVRAQHHRRAAQALNHSDSTVRKVAVKALGRIGNQTELPHEVMLAILQAFNDKDLVVRIAAAEAIFEIKGTENLNEEREAALATQGGVERRRFFCERTQRPDSGNDRK